MHSPIRKKVEIPVEKPVSNKSGRNCKQTAYLKAKERYDTQRENWQVAYKAKQLYMKTSIDVSADMVFRINYSFSDDTVKNIYF